MENSDKSVACNIQAKMFDLMVSLTQTCDTTRSIVEHPSHKQPQLRMV